MKNLQYIDRSADYYKLKYDSEIKYFKHYVSTGNIVEFTAEQFEQDLRNAIRNCSAHGLSWKRAVTADTTYYYFYSKYTRNTLLIYSIEKPIN